MSSPFKIAQDVDQIKTKPEQRNANLIKIPPAVAQLQHSGKY